MTCFDQYHPVRMPGRGSHRTTSNQLWANSSCKGGHPETRGTRVRDAQLSHAEIMVFGTDSGMVEPHSHCRGCYLRLRFRHLLMSLLAMAGFSAADLGSVRAIAQVWGPAVQTAADLQLERAKKDLQHMQELFKDGTVPKSRVLEAEDKLADANDESVLSHTLYSYRLAKDMTDAETEAMLQAAKNRVDRERLVVESRRKLLDSGVIARVDLESTTAELEDRERVLALAEARVRLFSELKSMAESERNLERAVALGSLKNAMIRYDGNARFNLNDMTSIDAQFQRRFHRALPVSALGQTLVHQSMGLDHRDRVDVALSPDSQEGTWLRRLLEQLHISYLAFRTAITGAATAPHIHIGTSSTRLVINPPVMMLRPK